MAALIRNKKAGLNYEILETFHAGMELFGFEVKSVRQHRGSLEGARIVVRGGEAFLVGASIPPYQQANTPRDYDPERARRLLLTKKEIGSLAGSEGTKGLTMVPISVYNAKRKLKLEFALVRGKKKHDKRETLKKKDAKRDMERAIKRRAR